MGATNTIPITEFAPAERVPIEIIHRQASQLENLPLTPQVLNSVLNYVLVLNSQRQIVFASENVQQLTPGRKRADLLGLRPGEALGCLHSDEHASGCGTTRFCSECGAVKAVLASLAGYNEIQECRLTRMIQGVPQALDLLVHASPLEYNGERFSLFCVSNIADQKRRRVLERIFFHDLINSLGGLDGLMEQIRVQAPDNLKTDIETADAACDSLLEQVIAQRDLAAAEHEDLMVWPTPLNATLLMRQVADLLRLHDVAADRTLRVAPGANAVALATDAVLLKRVLTNLAKNALEACAPGQVVTLGCAAEGDAVRFTVHNPGEIPGPAQLQIFNRSFSTKGEGRGLGTYSVKLLAEHYLKGRAGFTSDAETGTTFFVVLPKRLEG